MLVDHLVYATPDLDLGVDRIERLLGIRAAPGGQHPGAGTRNALIALGPDVYLEIVGPDREQPEPAQPRWFRIDELEEPRLVTWAAKSNDIALTSDTARQSGIELGDVIAGSRRRADGATRVALYRSENERGTRHHSVLHRLGRDTAPIGKCCARRVAAESAR